MSTTTENTERSSNPVLQAVAWSQDLVAQTFRVWVEVYKPFVVTGRTGTDELSAQLEAVRAEAREAASRAGEGEAARARLQKSLKDAETARDLALSERAAAEQAKTAAQTQQAKVEAERDTAVKETRTAETAAKQAQTEAEQARRALAEAQRELQETRRREERAKEQLGAERVRSTEPAKTTRPAAKNSGASPGPK